ncbi:MAG: hypothetical protein RBS23_06455 [Mariniphaga sp.]|nr:hypothetical protein [Mariniphaga sp.]
MSRESEAITRKTKDQKGRGEEVNGRRGDREMGRLEGQGDGATGRQEEPKPKTQNPELKTQNQ